MRTLLRMWLLLVVGSCNLLFTEAPRPDADADASALGWATVTAGAEHTCAIDTNGGLWCWGSNRFGQLAQPDSTRNALARKVNDQKWLAVSGRGLHTCGIRADATLWCWGANNHGQLGINSQADNSTVQRVTDSTFKLVETARHNTCAIDFADHLFCWGDNSRNQLGIPAQPNAALLPLQVDTATWLAVTVGDTHTCGLRTDQSVWCWGSNNAGQVNGIATVANLAAPVEAFPTERDWVSITAFQNTTCGVKASGTASCWGANPNGEFGNGLAAATSQKALAAGSNPEWGQIILGAEHTCGIKRDSREWWCWGSNVYGQLGQFSSLSQARAPVKMATNGEQRWLSVALGQKHSCAIDDNHQLACMGGDSEGQLGQQVPGRAPTTLPGPWQSYSVTGSTACGLLANGVWCWGNGRALQMGNAIAASLQAPSPVPELSIGKASLIAVGDRTVCAVVGANSYCWGTANTGEFGNGVATPQTFGRPTLAIANAYTEFNISRHACALLNGNTYCWGANNFGQAIRPGPTATAAAPTYTGGFQSITVGGNHSCGIYIGLFWYCWGDNTFGQLSGGDTAIHDVQVNPSIPTNQTFIQLFAGANHTCAIARNASAWCWGRNVRGELGDGTLSLQVRPVAVKLAKSWQQLAAGSQHTCGVTTVGTSDAGGTMWCWGDNTHGQLANNVQLLAREPVQIGSESDWVSVDAGEFFTCGKKLDGSLWCWGENSEGQLGNSTAWRAELRTVALP